MFGSEGALERCPKKAQVELSRGHILPVESSRSDGEKMIEFILLCALILPDMFDNPEIISKFGFNT
ncbi:hypothetical protein BH24DEI2_BH24DEI2_26180 [soil metagenome]